MTEMVFGHVAAARSSEPILIGLVVGMAASAPLAERLGLPPFYFVIRQAAFALLGVGLMVGISMQDVRTVRRLAVVGFVGALLTCLALPVIGTDFGKGAVRWVSLGVLTVAALTAARGVLIPLQCETLSHRGVGQLLDTVHDVRRFTNRKLEVWGVLPTLYDGRTNHSRTVLETIAETYELEVVEPPIPKTIKFAEAPAAGRSILATSRTSKGAQAYREVAANLVTRAGRKKR